MMNIAAKARWSAIARKLKASGVDASTMERGEFSARKWVYRWVFWENKSPS